VLAVVAAAVVVRVPVVTGAVETVRQLQAMTLATTGSQTPVAVRVVAAS
jgi:hypothetical protein